MHPLYFQIEPLTGPQSANMYLVVWPESGGNGRWCHHSHPDRTVLDAQSGDVLVHKRRQYRMQRVQRFGDWRGPWYPSVYLPFEKTAMDTLPLRKRQTEAS